MSGISIRWACCTWFAALFGVCLDERPALARGSTGSENLLAAEHVESLPSDIRRIISGRESACGSKAAARHYFSVSIEAGGQRFISLHFEEFACANRAAVCNADGRLHEVYLETHGRHLPVFSAHARDLKMTNNGGVLRLEVVGQTATQFLRWNGKRFKMGSNEVSATFCVLRALSIDPRNQPSF